MTARPSESSSPSENSTSETGPSPSTAKGMARPSGSKIVVTVIEESFPSGKRGSQAQRPERGSDVEAELDDVAVVHDVILALETCLATVPGLQDGAGVDQIDERDDLGLDEALLEVGVDHARGLRRLPALADRPRARFLRACRQVRLQAERVEADAGQLIQARLVLTGRRQQLGRILRVEVDELGLDLRVEEDRVGGGDQRLQGVFGRGIRQNRLVDVEDVDVRLRREQAQLLYRREVQARVREQDAALERVLRGDGGLEHGGVGLLALDLL